MIDYKDNSCHKTKKIIELKKTLGKKKKYIEELESRVKELEYNLGIRKKVFIKPKARSGVLNNEAAIGRLNSGAELAERFPGICKGESHD